MYILGITGPSGAGKGTVSRILRDDYHFFHIDTDLVSREIVPETLPRLQAAFGDDIAPDGVLDRKMLARRAFCSPENTATLNRIMHGAVMARVGEMIVRAEKQGYRRVCVDGAALFEAHAEQICHHIVAVTASREVRLKRVMERDSLSEAEAILRFDAQKPDTFYTEQADAVLVNHDLATLKCDISKLSKELFSVDELLYKAKEAFDVLSDEELKTVYDYCEGYKTFLDNSKIERFCVDYTVDLAKRAGFEPFDYKRTYQPGDKIYFVQKNKAAIFAVVGTETPEEGFRITAAHVDCPRIDLKPNPLYEDSGFALAKTHYYGGVKKYQWLATPLCLVGQVCKKNGESVRVCIGEDEDDPIFCITDILPHLAKDQISKPMGDAVSGESLNILLGSRPDGEATSDRFRLAVMKILHEKYGIVEADFLHSELSVVPAFRARDLGLDRSMIASFGHDDRINAYTAFMALLDIENPKKTCVCIFADREEVGSSGITGTRSAYWTDFLKVLCTGYDERLAFANSVALSADVTAAYDPNFAEVFEKRNSAYLNRGVGICKYTGARGKSGASEAPAEMMARLAGLYDEEGVLYQMCELGKVDQGGGGTVSQYMTDHNIETLDIGVAILCMHAPYEVAAKTDIYMMHKACKVFYERY